MASGSTDLRLRVALEMADKARTPLRNISNASRDAVAQLTKTRDTLRQLNAQQKDVSGYLKQKAELDSSLAKLRGRREQLEALRATEGASAKEINKASKALDTQTRSFEKQRAAVLALHQKLKGHGGALDLKNLSASQKKLGSDIEHTTQAMQRQAAALQALASKDAKLAELRERHSRDMQHLGMVGAAGAGAMIAGNQILSPVRSAVGAYADQEDALTQLRTAMMLADGSVPEEFRQINDLATKLGDRLPGTTADFQDMMTMLIRQGMSVKTILGGVGESAAYLGVQLKMPVTEAAEFAAKMQDATQTPEKDMMRLMDLIQKTSNLGVEHGNMLQGFTKMGPVLSMIHKEGIAGAQVLAPLLAMLDQSGLVGESAGNAVRKVFQAGLDAKKLGKANNLLGDMGAGFKLDFTNGNGQHGGLEVVFQQLKKIAAIKSDVARTSIIKELFGDDAETLQAVNTMMTKGSAGYEDFQNRMNAQADLQQRVNEQLNTLKNRWDAATGSFTNFMAVLGGSLAPVLGPMIDALGWMASTASDLAREYPVVTSALVGTVAVVGGLTAGIGALLLAYAGARAPFMVFAFLLERSRIAGGPLAKVFGLAATSLRLFGRALVFVGRGLWALAMNPVALAIAAAVAVIAGAAYLIYKNWEPIKGFFSGIWVGIKTAFSGGLAGVGALLLNWSPLGLLYKAFAGVLSWFGIDLPKNFSEFGANILRGLVDGILSGLGLVKDAISNVAGATIGWFKDRLGIRSPSRVFMDAGGYVGEGAALGIQRSTDLVRKATLGLSTAAVMAAPGMVAARDVPIDSRPPIAAAAAAAAPSRSASGGIVVQGDTITIQITAGPGMDSQALAKAVSAEQNRRAGAKAARLRSALADIE